MNAPNDIDRELNELANILLYARAFFDIYWHYENRETRKNITDVLNVYVEFFRYDIYAHQISSIVFLNMLFDTSKRAISIRKLSQEIKKMECIDQEACLRIDDRLASIESPVKKIKVIRDKALAHRAKGDMYKDVFREAGLSANELIRVMDVAIDVLNELRLARGLTDVLFRPYTTDTLRSMISDLKAFNSP
ncbi:hypothetical protein [uncultured Rhodospira sp.]|uniref:AbiU2 domain-containing protein n=1 Tax=uncultured Rhodospira sp. TaxID=1936189 RepID=UPI002627BFB9|nr:hypothetical protein [uncultured Rhodospira sp.]